MSGLEQRTQGWGEPPACTEVIAFTGPEPTPPVPLEWPAIDVELLDERRAPVPAFPLDVLPQPWRDWASEAALAADAPVDYVAQAVLAAVAGGCGRGVRVRATPDQPEPVRLWLAAVGAPATGKTAALEPVRRLLAGLESEPIDDDDEAGREVILYDGRFGPMLQLLNRTPTGRLLWRDGATNCLSPIDGTRSLRLLDRPALSILGTIEPDVVPHRVVRGLHGAGVATFLYAWPQPLPRSWPRPWPRPWALRRPARDGSLQSDEVQDHLRRILQMVGPNGGCRLLLEPSAAASFQAFHQRLHPEVAKAEDVEAAWLDKGRGAVAALAGVLALMAWSAKKSEEPPRSVDGEAMERAIALWSGYYRPHALAFLRRAVSTDLEAQASRVVRWLRARGATTVSRKEVTRLALAHTVDARGAERVMARLVEGGILLPMVNARSGRRFRLRWHVNPKLAALQG